MPPLPNKGHEYKSVINTNEIKQGDLIIVVTYYEKAKRKKKDNSSSLFGLPGLFNCGKRNNVIVDQTIKFTENSKIDCKDYTGHWFEATIIKIDNKNKRIKVHFDYWSDDYDAWFFMDDNSLQPFNTKYHEKVKAKYKYPIYKQKWELFQKKNSFSFW